jgi:hypothetical protein
MPGMSLSRLNYGAKKYVDWVKKYSILKPTLIESISYYDK